MSEPMQEAVPAFVGSDLAQVWSCCTVLPMTSAAFAAAFLSFSGTPLFVLFNISTSFISPARSAGTGGLAATCSTTECCCCTILSMTSAVFAAAFLSFSGALLLKNMSTSFFAGADGQPQPSQAVPLKRCMLRAKQDPWKMRDRPKARMIRRVRVVDELKLVL